MLIMLSNGQCSAMLEMIGYAYEFYLKKATIDLSATALLFTIYGHFSNPHFPAKVSKPGLLRKYTLFAIIMELHLMTALC
jgi:hypothetical protein